MGKWQAITRIGIHKNNVSVSVLTILTVYSTESSIYENENVPDLSYKCTKSKPLTNEPTEKSKEHIYWH